MAQSLVAVLPGSPDSHLICDSLKLDGIGVKVAHSPEDAIRLLASAEHSVVLYDADTGQPWQEAARNFLSVQPKVRIVLLMQSASRQTWLDLFDHGGFDLLLRPLQPADLRAVVRCALDPPKCFHRAAA
jgi:DNA-binding NtrC family response regulator